MEIITIIVISASFFIIFACKNNNDKNFNQLSVQISQIQKENSEIKQKLTSIENNLKKQKAENFKLRKKIRNIEQFLVISFDNIGLHNLGANFVFDPFYEKHNEQKDLEPDSEISDKITPYFSLL
ncbi:MAG: hypothetical protein LBF97_03365 [Elusimicrobiota bacterium]|jgi:hypothetical protein|nr:hypothetical protein [Elusimicrobiota bacterium]